MNADTVKNYFASEFSCTLFSDLLPSRHMSKRKFLLKLPFAGSPKGTLYHAGKGENIEGKIIGDAYLSAFGTIHYIGTNGDFSKIEQDEYVMVAG
jgi:hypothetical protein